MARLVSSGSVLFASLAALTVACAGADQDAGGATDAGASADAADDARVGADLGVRGDAGVEDAATPADAGATGLPAACEGDCARLDAEVHFGAARGGFERAFYGLSSPARSASGEWELHVEVLRGGAEGCPTMSAPTPDWDLVLTLPLLATAPLTETAGSVAFLDFDGRFLAGPRPLTHATAFTVTPSAARVCPACVGGAAPSDPGGFVAFTVDAAFAEGSVRGHVYATHCDSLDAP